MLNLLAEQRELAAWIIANPDDHPRQRGARLGLADLVAEELLMLLEIKAMAAAGLKVSGGPPAWGYVAVASSCEAAGNS